MPARRHVLKGLVVTAGIGTLPAITPARASSQPPSPRVTTLLDTGWRFHLGHAADPDQDFGFGFSHDTYAKAGEVGAICTLADFDDAAWQAVILPHDWAVDLPFTRFGPPGSAGDKAGAAQGFKPIGRRFPATSIGWYRRILAIPATDASRRLTLEFDGVSRDCLVILNGFVVGANESGYAPFTVDITDFAKPGADNILVVRCDASLGEAWSYEGGGLYRDVRLVSTAPVRVRQWGAFVRSEVTAAGALLKISTEIDNHADTAASVVVRSSVIAPDGRTVATAFSDPVSIAGWRDAVVAQEIVLPSPALWSIETPNLYGLTTEIIVDGRVVDADRTSFGIRTLRFDAKTGFHLNDKHVVIKGVCNHQDHAGVGAAVPDSLQRWRVEQMQAMGANAWRTTHHPPAPALLDACDRLGMLVLDETRQSSSNAEGLSQLERMVRRDRNHPSIFLWSIGNEEVHRGTDQGRMIATTMKRRVHALDGTRPVTEAFNGRFGKGASAVLDVMGFNYYMQDIDAFHAAHPDTPTIGTETGSTVMTRGEYVRDDKAGMVPAYDTDYPVWATTAENWWNFYAARPWIAGGFVWTGFDYRGEPTPFETWPSNASNFGQMDLCGFPKDNYHYYRAWWGAKPVLHLFPHWNWSGREGQPVDVWVHSNLDAVELLVNGISAGRKPVERLKHLQWTVPYEPGRIEARGFRNGRRVMTAVRETTGAPAGIALSSDRRTLTSGEVAVVRTAILDARGREMPVASNRVRFALEGPATLVGVGNGDPRSLEPDHAAERSAFNGLCMALIQATGPGPIRLVARGDGLKPAMLPLIGARG